MGNRAIITHENDVKQRGVYVQWNGGAGSVQAFIEETRRRYPFSEAFKNGTAGPRSVEIELISFYSTLYGVIREYFGYCTEYPSRSPYSVYMCGDGDAYNYTEDNGVYVIDDFYMCTQFNEPNYPQNEKDNVVNIREFYEKVHSALTNLNSNQENK